ncbi:hypothetical protein FWH30_02935 [Microgenomates group bacterium]|nr:hypothetical protein [Microgenomates group bacterium]
MWKVSAAEWSFFESMYGGLTEGKETYYGSGATVGGVVTSVLNWAYVIVAVVLLVAIIVSAYKIQLKEKKGLEEAKKSLKYAVIGIVIVAFAAAITNLINNYFPAGGDIFTP